MCMSDMEWCSLMVGMVQAGCGASALVRKMALRRSLSLGFLSAKVRTAGLLCLAKPWRLCTFLHKIAQFGCGDACAVQSGCRHAAGKLPMVAQAIRVFVGIPGAGRGFSAAESLKSAARFLKSAADFLKSMVEFLKTAAEFLRSAVPFGDFAGLFRLSSVKDPLFLCFHRNLVGTYSEHSQCSFRSSAWFIRLKFGASSCFF